MVWEVTAPPLLQQLRAQLVACPTWIGLVGAPVAADRIHYPTANPGGVRGPADRTPCALLMRPQAGRKKWIEGASGLIGGSVSILFYLPAMLSAGVPAAYAAGRVEDLVETLVGELIAQQVGIPFRDEATIGEASDPTDAEIAANSDDAPAAFRSCQATLPYGYST